MYGGKMRDWIGWAAGLFEGEGSVCLRSNVSINQYAHMELGMTDEDVVRKFHKTVGCGTVYLYRRKGRKDVWRWNLWDQNEIRRLYRLFRPYLGKRRRMRFEEVFSYIAACKSNPGIVESSAELARERWRERRNKEISATA
jgi:hypothetical protein